MLNNVCCKKKCQVLSLSKWTLHTTMQISAVCNKKCIVSWWTLRVAKVAAAPKLVHSCFHPIFFSVYSFHPPKLVRPYCHHSIFSFFLPAEQFSQCYAHQGPPVLPSYFLQCIFVLEISTFFSLFPARNFFFEHLRFLL